MLSSKILNKLHASVWHSTWIFLFFIHSVLWQNTLTSHGLNWRPWDPSHSHSTGDPPRKPTGRDTGISLGLDQPFTTTHHYFPMTRPDSDQSMVPTAATPDMEEASTLRWSKPRLNPLAPYSGEPTSFHSFLSQCSLTFSLQPSCFPIVESKVAFVIMHLARIAREWGTAMLDNKYECCSFYNNFSQELSEV